MHIPVTEYRRRLAYYHDLAREGEPVYVTDHGKPVVRVTAADEEAILERLYAEGRAHRPRRPKSPLVGDPVPYDGPPAEDVIAEQRR